MEHKSEQVMQIALANEWKAQVKPTIPSDRNYDNIVWDLYCVRGNETMHVQWIGDRFTDASYAYSGEIRKPARTGAAVRLLEGKPNLKKLNHTETETLLEDRSVPWVHDTPAVQILLDTMHREIHWIRKIDGIVCSAVVDVDTHSPTSMKHFRVYESPPHSGQRVLEWSDMLGFHTVALDQIVQVD